MKKIKTEEDKLWDNLKKEYLTTDEKLVIIRDFNFAKNDAKWRKDIEEIRAYMKNRDK